MPDDVDDNYAIERTSLILFQKVVSTLNERLKDQPDNATIKLKLIDFYRKLGHPDKVRELLESFEFNDLDTYHKNLWSYFSVKSPDSKISNSESSPFFQVHNFLSKPALEQIWQLIEQNLDKTRESQVSGLHQAGSDPRSGLYDSKTRSSRIINSDAIKPIRNWFLALIEDQLPKIKSQLSLTDYSIPQCRELQLTRHQHGDFYGLHQDISQDKNKPVSTRRFTFVYYFFKEPRGFDGGDLLMYVANTKEGLLSNAFTRIIPKNNTLIFFPSDRFHQVTMINSAGRGIEHSRFTLNGWFH
ncbi:MAG: 2OG-Fe(II) oxygenase [Roseivirga sp.]|nr:2OG-Fe(II) oxygenase [Roseivirga sp.]